MLSKGKASEAKTSGRTYTRDYMMPFKGEKEPQSADPPYEGWDKEVNPVWARTPEEQMFSMERKTHFRPTMPGRRPQKGIEKEHFEEYPQKRMGLFERVEWTAREWYYRDFQGNIQGPFDSMSMQNWYNDNYFTYSLPLKAVFRGSSNVTIDTGDFLPLVDFLAMFCGNNWDTPFLSAKLPDSHTRPIDEKIKFAEKKEEWKPQELKKPPWDKSWKYEKEWNVSDKKWTNSVDKEKPTLSSILQANQKPKPEPERKRSEVSLEPSTSPSESFLQWLRSSLQNLDSSVALDELIQVMCEFPVDMKNIAETKTTLAIMVLDLSTLIDGHQFANEFVRRRRTDLGFEDDREKPKKIMDKKKTSPPKQILEPKTEQPTESEFQVVVSKNRKKNKKVC